ncbi:hypothetical protein [Halopiger aswanensis]|uniref:Uncharacterized protein n=1 Tax=Halopiger aswanensis TaxID=148449 RepID=A0A3R7EBI5_9EURY|nr:hypothetical protein [Halopiger aswanensis]RKD85209.1 hypothetical protein ATJ93_4765 [Halopiger aswanensis]
MTSPNLNLSANLVDVVRNAYEYLDDFRPDTKAVRYNYREATSEMTFLIEVPNGRKRKFGKVKIPLSEGYRVKGMFSLPDYNPVNTVHSIEDGFITFNPENLPNQTQYILTLNGDVKSETLKEIVHLKSPEDPTKTEETDSYWVHSAIKRPDVMKDVYDDMQVENVDISLQVGVQRCFSNGIPDDVLEIFDSTRDLLSASSNFDRNEVLRTARKRHEARRDISCSPAEAADLIRSLATADNLQDYIEVDDPFRERNINPGTPRQNIFPESISVDVTTDLNLDRQAANGDIVFQKKEYENLIKNRTDDELM